MTDPQELIADRSSHHHVVIVGGGFGGLHAARGLGRAPVRVTLIDQRNFHLFQPLLYQVATGGLSPANIAAPLRQMVNRQRNTKVLLGRVRGIDAEARRVQVGSRSVPYDTLVLATGARHHYFGHEAWQEHAPGLKTIEDATEIRRRLLGSFEQAEWETDHDEIRRLLTFVVVGAGPTGVEMAGAIAELARHTLRRDFRYVDASRAQVLLIEGQDSVLPTFPPRLRQDARRSLERLGVTLRTGCQVIEIQADSLHLKAHGPAEVIPTRNVFWAAGVQASPLGRHLADQLGLATDRSGRLPVQQDCSLEGHPEIFVIGDLARHQHGTTHPLPGVAPVAMQQGRHVARVIQQRMRGQPAPPFRYRDRGSMATIGRAAAVAEVGGHAFRGYFAWLLWLFIHLLFLVGFQNRALVLLQWIWGYVTWNRSARLMVGGREEELTE